MVDGALWSQPCFHNRWCHHSYICFFLDPVGSLVSTLLVGWLLVVGHTFSKFVYFECCSVVLMVY